MRERDYSESKKVSVRERVEKVCVFERERDENRE